LYRTANRIKNVGRLMRRWDGPLLFRRYRSTHTAVGRSGRLESTGNNRRFSSASARVDVGMFPQEFPLGQQLLQLLVDVLLLWQ
jgi:hypothetical protein